LCLSLRRFLRCGFRVEDFPYPWAERWAQWVPPTKTEPVVVVPA